MDLAMAVNRAMQRGWLPLGGVAYVPMDPMQTLQSGQQQPLPFWQALVRPISEQE